MVGRVNDSHSAVDLPEVVDSQRRCGAAVNLSYLVKDVNGILLTAFTQQELGRCPLPISLP